VINLSLKLCSGQALRKVEGMAFAGQKILYQFNSIAFSANHIDAKALPKYSSSIDNSLTICWFSESRLRKDVPSDSCRQNRLAVAVRLI